MIIGIFDAIHTKKVPITFAKICLITRWCSGEGSFVQQSRIMHPDQKSVLIEGKNVPVKLASSETATTSVEIFIHFTFPKPGTYWVEISLDNDLKIRYPLLVDQINNGQ